MSTSHTLDKF